VYCDGEISSVTEVFDVIVVGGGPAGTAFACGSARQGKKVIVFEKNRAGSAKVCGGVLSPRCLRLFSEFGLRNVVEDIPAQRVEHLELQLATGGSIDIPFGNDLEPARVVDRCALDLAMWRAAGKAGATTLDEHAVTAIHQLADETWQVEIRNFKKEVLSVRAPILIGADGRNSFIAQQLGLKPKTRGRSLCFQYRLKKHPFCPKGVHFFIFGGGYCGLSVDGTGLAHLDVISLQGKESEASLMQRFKNQKTLFVQKILNSEFLPGKPVTRSPIGSGSRKLPSQKNVYLLGDAQKWVEPFTGEGISLSLQSAARVLCGEARAGLLLPKVSFTNRIVASALERPWLAYSLVCLLKTSPWIGKCMAREVLGDLDRPKSEVKSEWDFRTNQLEILL
jgi:menaquinone-9 beta-reductase